MNKFNNYIKIYARPNMFINFISEKIYEKRKKNVITWDLQYIDFAPYAHNHMKFLLCL